MKMSSTKATLRSCQGNQDGEQRQAISLLLSSIKTRQTKLDVLSTCAISLHLLLVAGSWHSTKLNRFAPIVLVVDIFLYASRYYYLRKMKSSDLKIASEELSGMFWDEIIAVTRYPNSRTYPLAIWYLTEKLNEEQLRRIPGVGRYLPEMFRFGLVQIASLARLPIIIYTDGRTITFGQFRIAMARIIPSVCLPEEALSVRNSLSSMRRTMTRLGEPIEVMAAIEKAEHALQNLAKESEKTSELLRMSNMPAGSDILLRPIETRQDTLGNVLLRPTDAQLDCSNETSSLE